LTQYIPSITVHVTFYLLTLSTHFLQANNFLTTNLMPFSTKLCHLQGILDSVLYHIKLTKALTESRFYNNSSVWTMYKNCGPRISKRLCQSDVLYDAVKNTFNPLNAKLKPIFHLLALLGAHHILHVRRIRVKMG
jgi:hypothetical protein